MRSLRLARRRGPDASNAALVRVCAHRGGAGPDVLADLGCFTDSAAAGYDLVEFDVRRTRDGIFVVAHDARLGSGHRVSELSLAELTAQSSVAPVLVDEVLAAFAAPVVAHIDMKESGHELDLVDRCVAALGSAGFVVTTLEDASVRLIKAERPEVRVALSLGRAMKGRPISATFRVRLSELRPAARIRNSGADAVAVNHRLVRLGVGRVCQRLGVPMMVWTVNNDQEIDRFLTMPGVETLITDRPRRAVERRAALSG